MDTLENMLFLSSLSHVFFDACLRLLPVPNGSIDIESVIEFEFVDDLEFIQTDYDPPWEFDLISPVSRRYRNDDTSSSPV